MSSELTTSHAADIIRRGTRIVIPTVLQDKVIQLALQGHQGIVKTKVLLRTKVWFPDIDCREEAEVHNCLACQANTPVTPIEPLKMSALLETPWHTVSVEFFGPLPTGEYLLITTDDYTRYLVVEIVRSTSANTVIPVMDKVISMFGIPMVPHSTATSFPSLQAISDSIIAGSHHCGLKPMLQLKGSCEYWAKPFVRQTLKDCTGSSI